MLQKQQNLRNYCVLDEKWIVKGFIGKLVALLKAKTQIQIVETFWPHQLEEVTCKHAK